MRCKFEMTEHGGLDVLEGENNLGVYDIIVSARELISKCLRCDDKCEERFSYVKHINNNAKPSTERLS